MDDPLSEPGTEEGTSHTLEETAGAEYSAEDVADGSISPAESNYLDSIIKELREDAQPADDLSDTEQKLDETTTNTEPAGEVEHTPEGVANFPQIEGVLNNPENIVDEALAEPEPIELTDNSEYISEEAPASREPVEPSNDPMEDTWDLSTGPEPREITNESEYIAVDAPASPEFYDDYDSLENLNDSMSDSPQSISVLSEPETTEEDSDTGSQTTDDSGSEEHPDEEIIPVSQPSQVSTDTAYTVQEVTADSEVKKIALILSGGGARGAFQVGAEMYARQVKGYRWDIIAGVSVGAMNGAILAMHRFARLLEIWDHISDNQIYTGGYNLLSAIKLLFGAKGFYGNEPLKRMMETEFEAGQVIDDLHVGAVSLISGKYEQFTKEFLELPAAILASSSIPVVWPPVDISPDHLAMVDGGVRNNSPVGDVLELEPDEIVIINCSSQNPGVLKKAPDNVLDIGMRTLDIMQNEIFINDIKEFERINALVKEAGEQGIELHHPRTGRAYKYYPYVVIEPDIELGDTLDFSQSSVQTALKAGVRRAREILGRP